MNSIHSKISHKIFLRRFYHEAIFIVIIDRVDVLCGRFCRLRWGGGNSADSEQTQSLNEDSGSGDTNGEDTTYDPNEEGRGGSS